MLTVFDAFNHQHIYWAGAIIFFIALIMLTNTLCDFQVACIRADLHRDVMAASRSSSPERNRPHAPHNQVSR